MLLRGKNPLIFYRREARGFLFKGTKEKKLLGGIHYFERGGRVYFSRRGGGSISRPLLTREKPGFREERERRESRTARKKKSSHHGADYLCISMPATEGDETTDNIPRIGKGGLPLKYCSK